MLYKRFIHWSILGIFVLALATGWYFLRLEQSPATSVDTTPKLHATFYQQALAVWDAKLATGPFRENSSTAIRLTWQQPEELYNHFLITITDPQTGWTRTESGEHDRVSLDVTDLQADTKYVFVVRACLNPDCANWIVSHVETQAQTPTTRWQLMTTIEDQTGAPERENWQEKIQLNQLTLLDETGQTLSDEEKNAFVLERVMVVDDLSIQFLTLSTQEGTIQYAQLMNP